MNVFITGASSGIGLYLANQFLERGDQVGIIALEPFDQVKDQLKGNVSYHQGNVSNSEEIEKALNQFMQDKSTLDIVIANAGINHPKNEILDFERGELVLKVNIFGVFYVFEQALKYMLKQNSGHLITMSSLSALNGLPHMSAYGSSKAWVRSFSESMQLDLAEKGIGVTCFAPGYVKTPLTKDNAHNMPHQLELEEAGEIIFKNIIERRTGLISFPLVPSLFMGLLSCFPRNWYIKIISSRLFRFF